MRFFRLVFAILLGLAVGHLARASNAADAPHVHVQLIASEDGATAPGQFLAGLHFKLESGWHVYWMNPGDAGQPPKMVWTLPSGVTAGPLQFPAPKRLPLGPLMDFGYEDQVLFPLTLTIDSSNKPGSTIHLAGKASWLVCRETCIPGKANLDLDVPVISGSPAASASTPLFQQFLAKLPKPMPINGKLGFAQTADGYRLTAITGRRETEAQFFPADPDLIANAAPQDVTPTSKGLTLGLKKDPNAPPAKPTTLRGLLELSGGRAYEIAASSGSPVSVETAAKAESSAAPAPTSAQASNALSAPRIGRK
jgi:DsbC/DsbD-like thiol-disulfide interchange protein